MAGETPVLIGFFGDSVPDGDQTAAEELSKFGGNPVSLKPASCCVTYWTAPFATGNYHGYCFVSPSERLRKAICL